MRISDWSSDVCSSDLYQSNATPDQTSRGGFASADVRLRPRLSLGAQAVYERRRFATADRRVDRDYSLQLALSQAFTRQWTARLRVQRRERNSANRVQSYNENKIFIDNPKTEKRHV